MTGIDYDALAENPSTDQPSDADLKSIADLAARQTAIEAELADLERQTRAKNIEYEKVRKELLPTAMAQVGLTDFTLESGEKISIKKELRAGITEVNKPWCFTWLRGNGHGDIIRNEIKMSFGVGQDDQAAEMVATINEKELPFNQKEYVHHRTLPAFVRAELEENDHGEEWEKKFGVFRESVAKIQRPD